MYFEVYSMVMLQHIDGPGKARLRLVSENNNEVVLLKTSVSWARVPPAVEGYFHYLTGDCPILRLRMKARDGSVQRVMGWNGVAGVGSRVCTQMADSMRCMCASNARRVAARPR